MLPPLLVVRECQRRDIKDELTLISVESEKAVGFVSFLNSAHSEGAGVLESFENLFSISALCLSADWGHCPASGVLVTNVAVPYLWW